MRSLSGRGDVGTAVTVAFMDIKSACKARQTENKLDERYKIYLFQGGLSKVVDPH